MRQAESNNTTVQTCLCPPQLNSNSSTGMMSSSYSSFFRAFGPGLLFAAVAIGVSHLVQSTRAGAFYGPAMILFVFASMAVKYPFYRFGPQYTAATGRTLVDAFRLQGLWVFIPFALLMVFTSFIAIAALSSGTAVIAGNAFHLSYSPVQIAIVLLVVNAVILGIGRYHWLDIIMKVFILILSLSTIAATLITLPIIDWSRAVQQFPPEMSKTAVIFIVALVGWMPAPLEGAVGLSLWTKAKASDSGYQPRIKESIMDFHVGYVGTLFLSFCFMLLGAGVLQEQGDELARGAAQFTGQFISLYESALGEWSGLLVRIAAAAVMYSTLLAATDSYVRMISSICMRLHTPEYSWERDAGRLPFILNIVLIIILSAGGFLVFILFSESFPIMLAIATSVAFISAPFIALLIYRAIISDDVTGPEKPQPGLRMYSIFCIGALTVFAIAYIFLLLT